MLIDYLDLSKYIKFFNSLMFTKVHIYTFVFFGPVRPVVPELKFMISMLPSVPTGKACAELLKISIQFVS